ncbi:MAG: hypothetical protein U0893_06725 [Chloroflexota bacterium]
MESARRVCLLAAASSFCAGFAVMLRPSSLAVRFEAQTTELYDRVKGLMRDSQSADLPNDVAPGESATVHLSFVAPPEPGRYTMILHVTRIGVPGSKTRVERTVRVVDRR